jgi:hypothetical protein
MKKILFTIALAFALNANAQTPPDYSRYPLDTEANIKKADEAAKQTAVYLLGTPVTKEPQKRLEAMQYLFEWMEATPNYSFAFDKAFTLVGQDQQLMGIFIAALSKYHLDNNVKQGGEASSLFTLKAVAEYVGNANNGITPQDNLKKLVDANKNGKLKEFYDGL